jgi:hypothetical protein
MLIIQISDMFVLLSGLRLSPYLPNFRIFCKLQSRIENG